MAEEVAQRGIKRIDFGPGPERYKQDFKTDDRMLIQGVVEHHRLRRSLRHAWHRTKRFVRNTPMRGQLEAGLNWSYRLREWLAVR